MNAAANYRSVVVPAIIGAVGLILSSGALALPVQHQASLQCECKCSNPGNSDRMVVVPWSGTRAECRALTGAKCTLGTQDNPARGTLNECDALVAHISQAGPTHPTTPLSNKSP